MKLTEFMVVIIAALVFLIPVMNKENNLNQIQAQEESQEKIYREYDTARISFHVSEASQESIADILWMKKAANFAKEQGIPYFNIIEQNISSRFVRSADRYLSIIEGIIELDPDPMQAEYDAHEIENLVLSN